MPRKFLILRDAIRYPIQIHNLQIGNGCYCRPKITMIWPITLTLSHLWDILWRSSGMVIIKQENLWSDVSLICWSQSERKTQSDLSRLKQKVVVSSDTLRLSLVSLKKQLQCDLLVSSFMCFRGCLETSIYLGQNTKTNNMRCTFHTWRMMLLHWLTLHM